MKIFKKYRHITLLIFWPCYLLSYLILERFLNLNYIAITNPLDKHIPFCEFFIVPYVLWYFLLAFIQIYTIKYDIEAFKKFMYFLIITFSTATVIFILFPNMQNLRVNSFERENIFTRFTFIIYSLDTHTNVCPSLHTVGALGILFDAFYSKKLNHFFVRVFFIIATILIIASTVFLKQHSLTDVIAGIFLSVIAYPLAFLLPDKIKSYISKKDLKTLKNCDTISL